MRPLKKLWFFLSKSERSPNKKKINMWECEQNSKFFSTQTLIAHTLQNKVVFLKRKSLTTATSETQAISQTIFQLNIDWQWFSYNKIFHLKIHPRSSRTKYKSYMFYVHDKMWKKSLHSRSKLMYVGQAGKKGFYIECSRWM